MGKNRPRERTAKNYRLILSAHSPNNTKDSAVKKRSLLFGRKKGRPLSKVRAQAMAALMPVMAIDSDSLNEDASLNPAALFPHPYQKMVFEIGFGDGERLAQHIQREPETAFLGAEHFLNGVAGFCGYAHDFPHANARIFMGDGIKLAQSLAPGTINEIYVLNPDPWHKKRHHKRRIINTENLDIFARILKPKGKLILTTDVPYLADWMMIHSSQHPAFAWTAHSIHDWQTPPEHWIPTRYESKGAKGGKKMVYMIFEKTCNL